MSAFIRWFDQTGMDDLPLVGGKNASLDEMWRELGAKGVNFPNGFCVAVDGYRHFLKTTFTILEAEKRFTR